MTISILITCLLFTFSQLASQGKKGATVDGEKVFKEYCSECHEAGGNKVKPTKPVCGSKKLATLATLKAYLEAPLGHMPYYEHVIQDKAVLDALYKYCKKLCKVPRQQASL